MRSASTKIRRMDEGLLPDEVTRTHKYEDNAIFLVATILPFETGRIKDAPSHLLPLQNESFSGTFCQESAVLSSQTRWRDPMSQFIPEHGRAALDGNGLALITKAVNASCDALAFAFRDGKVDLATRNVLARHIAKQALAGETNPIVLSSTALRTLPPWPALWNAAEDAPASPFKNSSRLS